MYYISLRFKMASRIVTSLNSSLNGSVFLIRDIRQTGHLIKNLLDSYRKLIQLFKEYSSTHLPISSCLRTDFLQVRKKFVCKVYKSKVWVKMWEILRGGGVKREGYERCEAISQAVERVRGWKPSRGGSARLQTKKWRD